MWFRMLVAVCLVLRGFLLWYIGYYGGDFFQPDSERYVVLAHSLAETGWFSLSSDIFAPEVFRTPGYPAFLAVLKIVGLSDPIWVAVAQELVYVFCVYLAFQGIRSLLSERLARTAVVFMLLEPGGLAFPKLLISETLFLPFVICAVFAAGFYLRNQAWRWAFASGLLIGAGVLVRPAAAYLPLLLLPIMWLGRKNARGFGIGALALLLGISVFVAPWLIRNQVHFGQPFMSGQTSNLLAHFHVPMVWETARKLPFERGQAEVREHIDAAQQRSEQETGTALNSVERHRLEQAWAIGELSQYLPAYATQWMFGVAKAIFGSNILELYHVARLRTDRVRFYQIEETSFVPKVTAFLLAQDPLVSLEALARVAIALLALVGAWAILRSSDPFLWFLLLVNLYFLSIAGPMGYGRLRFPVEVFWFVQAMLGLGWIVRRFEWRSATKAVS